MNDSDKKKPTSADDFAKEAEVGQASFLSEFVDFLLNNKKWWLTPIILVLLILGIAVVFTGTGAAPFIYTLF